MSGFSAIGLELAVVVGALAILVIGVCVPAERRSFLTYAAAVFVGLVLLSSFLVSWPGRQTFFEGTYLLDGLALFFKRLFLVAACFVLLLTSGSSRKTVGGVEFPVLVLIALAGMMFAASAGGFVLLFVALELVTVTFYVLVAFARDTRRSLEAGVKFLIIGAVTSAFLVLGMALVYGSSGTMDFDELRVASMDTGGNLLFDIGLVLVFVGVGFKLAAVPSQMWVPDVYEGAPAPVGAFLASGSKAVGLVLILRVMNSTAERGGTLWAVLLAVSAAASILYGALCAIPQKDLKRLLGYSSIVTAGYLLVGLTSGSEAGIGASLYYMTAYVFAVLAVFGVVSIVFGAAEPAEIAGLGGLYKRSPLLAVALTLSMISLAGVPPMAGFFGKFLLVKSAVGSAWLNKGLVALIVVMVVGILISIYYYFGVIRAVYWGASSEEAKPITVTGSERAALIMLMVGLVWLGLFPGRLIRASSGAVESIVTPRQVVAEVMNQDGVHP